jgi:hypothetical protein
VVRVQGRGDVRTARNLALKCFDFMEVWFLVQRWCMGTGQMSLRLLSGCDGMDQVVYPLLTAPESHMYAASRARASLLF